MSADNYYIIRKDVHGLFVPVMGFASADEDGYVPRIESRDARFTTLNEAIDYASNDYSEYGVSVHPECDSDEVPVLEQTNSGHYFDCPEGDQYWELYNEGPAVCLCEDILADWSLKVEPRNA